jgi:hypothetical protein
MIIYSIIDVISVLGTKLFVVVVPVVYVDRFNSITSRRISYYSNTLVMALIRIENGQI